MIYAGARAYIGTLFPITPIEASEVITKVLDAHWGKPLAVALWWGANATSTGPAGGDLM